MTHIRGLITQLITTPEPPSRPYTLYPYRIPMDPLKGTLKGTLITNPEPPSNPPMYMDLLPLSSPRRGGAAGAGGGPSPPGRWPSYYSWLGFRI